MLVHQGGRGGRTRGVELGVGRVKADLDEPWILQESGVAGNKPVAIQTGRSGAHLLFGGPGRDFSTRGSSRADTRANGSQREVCSSARAARSSGATCHERWIRWRQHLSALPRRALSCSSAPCAPAFLLATIPVVPSLLLPAGTESLQVMNTSHDGRRRRHVLELVGLGGPRRDSRRPGVSTSLRSTPGEEPVLRELPWLTR